MCNNYWVFGGLDFGALFWPVDVAEGSITGEANLIKSWSLWEFAVAICAIKMHLARTALKHVI